MTEHFLLTTGRAPSRLRESKLLIAGDWCGDKQDFIASTTAEILDYPIKSLDAVKIKEEIDTIFHELLSRMVTAYNDVFGLCKDKSYYRIVLGRWIYHFLHNIYEKRKILTNASEKYPNLWTESCGITYALSYDSDDYNAQSYSSHDFNFRMYSGVAEFLSGIRKSYIEVDNAPIPIRASTSGIKMALKHALQCLACQLNKAFLSGMTLVVSPYYPRSSLYNALWFFVKSHGEIVHYKFAAIQPSGVGVDVSLRKLLSEKIRRDPSNELLQIAAELLFYFMPQCFVEYFASYRAKALRWLKSYGRVKCVFTANAIHTDEPFKYLVAEAQPQDLWISQHGAGYGFSEVHVSEISERELATRYFTWGWGEDVLPHPKLTADARIRYRRNEDIVFTCPTVQVYAGLLESYFIASNYQNAMQLSDQLFGQLASEILAKVVLRQLDLKGMRFYRPQIAVRKDGTESFHDSLKRARVHLSNHIGTPVLESLAMNFPTVVLHDPTIQRLRPSAAPFFEELKAVQILFEDPREAAQHLNSVYSNIDEWWMRDTTQAAVKSFCKRFAQSDRNWRTAWLNVLTNRHAG